MILCGKYICCLKERENMHLHYRRESLEYVPKTKENEETNKKLLSGNEKQKQLHALLISN